MQNISATGHSRSPEARVRSLLARAQDAPFAPTGVGRDTYLDIAERLIRTAATWQDQSGAIIDPVVGAELGQTSPRFVSSAALLLQFGRIEDLRPHVLRGMDWCTSRLAGGLAKSPDFWIRELLTAWLALRGQPVPVGQRQVWEEHLRSIDPEAIYSQVSRDGARVHELHNWTVYAAAGEGLRHLAGLGPRGAAAGDIVWGAKFFEKYMPPQLNHFSAEGLYRDPGDPFTYDMTTRLQFATPLAYGFQTPLRAEINDVLRRGALSQLLYVSPAGYAPFGGRSNQFHLQEAILAALGELEANRYKTSDPVLARAFKRHAHLSVQSVQRWLLEMQPHRHLKNGFAPSEMHGCEDYAGYAVYSLFTASCLGLAALFADESVEEGITPAEIGGYTFELAPAFHKIFATVGQTQIEIDTAADPAYDATGLGRFHRAGTPLELGLGFPITSTPKYRMAPELKSPLPVAIGPGWKDAAGAWKNLAALSEGLTHQFTALCETADEVAFELGWRHEPTAIHIRENYRLTAGNLRYSAEVQRDGHSLPVRLNVPLLETDGLVPAKITVQASEAQVVYRGSRYRVTYGEDVATTLQPAVGNRNGIYRILQLDFPGPIAHVTLELGKH
jgi:hypothetical protein